MDNLLYTSKFVLNLLNSKKLLALCIVRWIFIQMAAVCGQRLKVIGLTSLGKELETLIWSSTHILANKLQSRDSISSCVCICRYYAIVHPLSAMKFSSKSRTKKILAATWAIPVILASPYTFSRSYPFVISSDMGSVSRQICNDRWGAATWGQGKVMWIH